MACTRLSTDATFCHIFDVSDLSSPVWQVLVSAVMCETVVV